MNPAAPVKRTDMPTVPNGSAKGCHEASPLSSLGTSRSNQHGASKAAPPYCLTSETAEHFRSLSAEPDIFFSSWQVFQVPDARLKIMYLCYARSTQTQPLNWSGRSNILH